MPASLIKVCINNGKTWPNEDIHSPPPCSTFDLISMMSICLQKARYLSSSYLEDKNLEPAAERLLYTTNIRF